MEDPREFVLEIDNLLTVKGKELEEKVLPRLHSNFSIYHKSLQTIFNVLVRKSLLQEDPYKYEHKISEITIPSQAPIAENDKGMQMSIRLSNFESQLEFLNHYYQFSLEFLDMKKLKLLATLTTYIKWEKGLSASDHNTSILFELMNKISAESDPVSSGILKNAQQGLIKQTKLILKDLKDLSNYHRELYKQGIRSEVIPQTKIDEKTYSSDSESSLRMIRQKFGQLMEGKPFYTDLAREVLNELYSENGPELRSALLSKYRTVKKETVKKKDLTHKVLLTDALKILANGGAYLDQAVSKIRTNIGIIENKKETLGEKFRIWLKRIVSKDGDKRIMDLEIFDEETSLSKTIRLDYNLFIEKTTRQGRLLRSFGSEMSQTYQKIAAAREEQVYKYLSDRITELQKTTAFLGPIETYLKTEASREQRNRIISIEKEIENIRSCIKRTNSKRFDYSSRIEEQEQLKRLGIDS